MSSTAKRREVLIGIGLTALTACAPAYPPRGRSVADGDRTPLERPAEGGVGGTGIGGTGIVGILNGAGSLLINGLRVLTPRGVPLRDAYGPLGLDRLAVGHALTVEAIDDGGDALVARSISVVHPLIGPIEAVTENGIRCLGVAVTLEPGIPLAGPAGTAFAPAVGQRVAVSGLWRGDGVVASRVDAIEATETRDVIAGEVKPGADGSIRLGTLELALPAGAAVPPVGSFATAVGRREGTGFAAARLGEGRFQGLAGPLQRLSVEGYLESTAAAPGYAVSGLGHSFDSAARLAALTDRRVLFVGAYDGTFRVDHGLPLPDAIADRRALLIGIEDGFAPDSALPTR